MKEKIDTSIESLIPHRDRMKLLDKIIFIDVETDEALTESIVSEEWPTFCDGGINTVLGIELIAQTVAVSAGWKSYKKTGEGEKGWLIGVKKSSFIKNKIPAGTTIRTYISTINYRSNYGTFKGIVTEEGKEIMTAEIQVFRPDDSLFQ